MAEIKYDDGKVIHSCQGQRMVPFDPGTFLVWTDCGRDVPSNHGFRGGPNPTCPACAESRG